MNDAPLYSKLLGKLLNELLDELFNELDVTNAKNEALHQRVKELETELCHHLRMAQKR